MTRPLLCCFLLCLSLFVVFTAILTTAMVASVTALVLLLTALGLCSVVFVASFPAAMVASTAALDMTTAFLLRIVFGRVTQALREGEFHYLTANKLLNGSKA